MKSSLTVLIFCLLSLSFSQASEAKYFQIGNKFERSFHKDADQIPPKLKKAAYSVAQFGSSTAFYIGKHNGKDVMATTAHSALIKATDYGYSLDHYKKNPEDLCKIFIDSKNSPRRYFKFNLLDQAFDCKKLIAIFPELDLAFFELQPEGNFDLSPYGIKFRPPQEFKKGLPLQFFSYSGFQNPGHLSFDLGFTHGKLCTPLINSDKIDFMESSDDLTKDPLEIPAIPIGCDTSPGDSGAPLLDQNGALVGVLWSVSNSDNPLVSNEDYLETLIMKKTPYTKVETNFVWKNFNYASSLEKSIRYIEEKTKSCETVACKVLKSLIRTD